MRNSWIRLCHAVVTLFGVSALSFLLAELAPGDLTAEMRLNPSISDSAVEDLRARYGLDDSLPRKYGRWLASLAKGELGFSFAHGRPVIELLPGRLRNTLVLTVSALLLAWFLALALGAWAAHHAGGWVDRATMLASSTLLAVPQVLLGLLALLVAVRVEWLPLGGMVSLDFEQLSGWQRAWDLLRHLLLPVLALALASLPVLVMHVRTAFLEALSSPFLRATRAHGLSPRRRFLRYTLPAAANPLISLFGFSFGGLLSGSILIEVILGWPGIGPLMLDAILARDQHLVLACLMLSSLLLIVANAAADLLLTWLDPRIREV